MCILIYAFTRACVICTFISMYRATIEPSTDAIHIVVCGIQDAGKTSIAKALLGIYII